MQTFNQTILNGMIEKSIGLLEKSSRYNDSRLLAFLRKVPVTINTRLRTKGGLIRYRIQPYTKIAYDLAIEINPDYCLRATDEQVYNTVAHELSHAYHVLLTQSTDHGTMWQSIHRAMGGTAERCHKVEVQKNNVQRHQIRDLTDGKTYTVSTRRWNQLSYYRLLDGTARFVKQSSYIKPQPAMA
jgi:predicted SprT family Zn-dependent metalloprotease